MTSVWDHCIVAAGWTFIKGIAKVKRTAEYAFLDLIEAIGSDLMKTALVFCIVKLNYLLIVIEEYVLYTAFNLEENVFVHAYGICANKVLRNIRINFAHKALTSIYILRNNIKREKEKVCSH